MKKVCESDKLIEEGSRPCSDRRKEKMTIESKRIKQRVKNMKSLGKTIEKERGMLVKYRLMKEKVIRTWKDERKG